MVLEPPEGGLSGAQSLEAILSGSGNFPPVLDIPPDADDEAMVELAIALSLQEQQGQSGGLSLQGLRLGNQLQRQVSIHSAKVDDGLA